MKILLLSFLLLSSFSTFANTSVSCFTNYYFGSLNLNFKFDIDSSNNVKMDSSRVNRQNIEVVSKEQGEYILSSRSSHEGYLSYLLGTDNTGETWMSLSFRIPSDYKKKSNYYKGYVLAEDGHGASLHQVLCINR